MIILNATHMQSFSLISFEVINAFKRCGLLYQKSLSSTFYINDIKIKVNRKNLSIITKVGYYKIEFYNIHKLEIEDDKTYLIINNELQ